jgi:hypothetical protein
MISPLQLTSINAQPGMFFDVGWLALGADPGRIQLQ